MDKFPITKQGYEKLREEIENLKKLRLKISSDISEAREHGDLSENAEFHAARDAQGLNEAKIRDLESKYSRAEIIDFSKLGGDKVQIGASVTVLDDKTDKEIIYVITGVYEAASNHKKSIDKLLVSIASPVARALMGKQVGDTVEVEAPSGDKFYEIMKIEYKEIVF